MTVLRDIVAEFWDRSDLILDALDIFDEAFGRVRWFVAFFLLFETLVNSFDVVQMILSFLSPRA